MQQLQEKKKFRGGSEAQFPGKLHDMMKYIEEQNLESEIISWVMEGRAFQIHNPDRLVEILPLFFSQTKYRSFRRQLNMWHFERVQEGPHRGAFFHPYFVQGNKALCTYMSRHISPKQMASSVSLPSKFCSNMNSWSSSLASSSMSKSMSTSSNSSSTTFTISNQSHLSVLSDIFSLNKQQNGDKAAENKVENEDGTSQITATTTWWKLLSDLDKQKGNEENKEEENQSNKRSSPVLLKGPPLSSHRSSCTTLPSCSSMASLWTGSDTSGDFQDGDVLSFAGKQFFFVNGVH